MNEGGRHCWCGAPVQDDFEQFCSAKCRRQFKRAVGVAALRAVRWGQADPHLIRLQLEAAERKWRWRHHQRRAAKRDKSAQ